MARELRKRKGQPETTLPAGAEAQNDDPVPDASSESEASFSDSDSTSGEEEEEAKDDCMEQPAKRRRRKVQRAGGVKSSAYTGRRFQCPECPKSFRLEIHLQAHTRIHTGERKFQCKFPGCPYWAQHKSVLVSHERTHTGEKPYKCSFAGCTFAFTQDAPLKAHERRHTGEKPYFCGIEGCAYRGIQRTSLLDHVTRLHPQNVLKDAMGKQKTVVDPSQPRVDLLAGQTVFVKKGPPRNKLTTKPPHTKVSASSAPSEVAAILRTDEVMSEEPEAPEQPGMTEEEAREIVANLKLGPAQIGTRIYKALYTCPLDDCEYTCRLTEKMFDHLRLHGRNPEPHLCGIGGCPVRTRSRPQMEVHVKKEHSGRGLHETQMMKLRYACTVEGCTASFRKNAVLAFHLRDQHGPFICGIQGCGDVLESPASLRAHVQSRHPGHTVDDTLKARLGESVNQYTVAELSEKYALGKVLRCSFAQKFATAKGYTTPCPFTCTDKVRLDEHKKLVHGGKTPYLCGIGGCLYRCKDSSRLKVHVKSLHPKADYEKDAVKREFLGSTFLMPDASSEQNLAKTDAIHERVGSSTTTQNESSEDLCEMDDQSEVSTKDLGFDKLLVEILAVKPPSPFKALPQADDVKDTESCGADFVMDETEDVMEQDVDGIEHTVNGLPSVVAPVELDVSQPIVLPVIQAEDVATSPQVYLVGLDDAGSAGRFQMKVTGMTRCSVPMSKGGMQQMGYFVTFEDFEGLERHLPAGLVSSSASKNFTVSF